MFGNKQGWIISVLIVVVMGWMIVRLGRPVPPTPPSGQFSYLTEKIELPTKPESLRPIFTEKRDAGDLYWQAAQEYMANRSVYDNFFTPRKPKFSRLENLPTVEPAMKLLLQGAHATDAKIFMRDPKLLVDYQRYPYPELDGLFKLGRIAGQIGLAHAAKGAFDEAEKYYDAELSLGKKLFDERINATELLKGHGLMREAAALYALLAEKRNDPARQAQFQAFDQQLKQWHDTRFDKLSQAVIALDAGQIKRNAGDVFVLATESPERVWRVEALMKLGRYKFNAGTDADQHRAKRYLSNPASVGQTDPTADPQADAAVRLAYQIARDLTEEGFNQIRLTD